MMIIMMMKCLILKEFKLNITINYFKYINTLVLLILNKNSKRRFPDKKEKKNQLKKLLK